MDLRTFAALILNAHSRSWCIDAATMHHIRMARSFPQAWRIQGVKFSPLTLATRHELREKLKAINSEPCSNLEHAQNLAQLSAEVSRELNARVS